MWVPLSVPLQLATRGLIAINIRDPNSEGGKRNYGGSRMENPICWARSLDLSRTRGSDGARRLQVGSSLDPLDAMRCDASRWLQLSSPCPVPWSLPFNSIPSKYEWI